MGNFRLIIAVVTGLAATLLWDDKFFLPVKLLIVLIHESFHGLTALSAGGALERITLDWSESGETLIRGLTSPIGFIISISSGYTGTALLGGYLLNRGLIGKTERFTLFIFAALLWFTGYIFTDVGSLAFWVGVGWSLFFAVIVMWGDISSRITLVILGTLLVWYSVFDLYDFTRDLQHTDAGMLAQYLLKKSYLKGIEPFELSIWISACWTAVMATGLFFAIRPVIRHSDISLQESAFEPEAPPVAPPFPGEVTPEIENWLLENGFGPDGLPLYDKLNSPDFEVPVDLSIEDEISPTEKKGTLS